jgi:hypothetical protein
MEQFLTQLKRFRAQWQGWLLRCLALELIGWIIVTMTVLCFLDLFLALAPKLRVALGGLCFLCLLAWLGIRLAGIYRITEKDSAIHADRLLQSRRREILSALEVGQSRTNQSPLSAYLSSAGIESAGKQLKSVANIRPEGRLKKIYLRLSLFAGILLISLMLSPRGAITLAGRLLLPYADIPPYTGYVFVITPTTPEVIYGADQIINLSVSGKTVHTPVRFVTRQNGHILESTCFQAGPAEFVQRLERVMQPMEFCFRVGKARSKWHPLTVLFQPHVQSAKVRTTPPTYTKRPEKEFALGTESIEGLKGTQVALTIQSNRPLKGGQLLITPTDGITHSRTLTGRQTGENEISFYWEMNASARLAFMITDIQGTSAREPVKVFQKLIPDEPPVVTIIEPMTFSLATSTVKVPVFCSIEDDIGIRRCDLFRSLKGYRSYPSPIDVYPGSTILEVEKELDLARLGVEPGQVIELFLEASDTNPDLTGIASSDIARILIISDAEYAQMVRYKTSITAFEDRFLMVAKKYHELLQHLENTEADLKKGKLNTDQTQSQMQILHSQITAAAGTIRKIAEEFTAFDLEKKLAESAGQMAGILESALDHEGWKSPDNAMQLTAVSNTIRLMKDPARQGEKLKKDAVDVASVGRVMAMGAWYRALMDRQKILVSRLEQHAAGDRKISEYRFMAELENTIRQDFQTLISELEQRAKELPEGYENLRKSALEFVHAVRRVDAPAPMTACENACKNEQPREAWRYAQQALEKMAQVLNESRDSAFERTCSGEINFQVPGHLSLTMSQMLESLMKQFARGVGWGESIGAAGVGLGGAWEGSYMNGYSAFNLPVYGPKRKNPFSSAAMGKAGNKDGNGSGNGMGQDAQYKETMQSTDKQKAGGTGFSMETVPVKYREAVKAFYSEEK